MMRRWLGAGLAGTCVLVLSSTAMAEHAPDVTVAIDAVGGGSMFVNLGDSGVDNEDGTWDFDGSNTSAFWNVGWDMTVDPDPFINSAFAVTNNTAVTQTYIITVELPIAPVIVGSSTMGASMQGGLTDNTFNTSEAVVSTNGATGAPFFQGLIDGVGVLPLYPHLSSFMAPFDGGSANIPAVSAGLPGITIPGPAVSTKIGITHEFTLTAGDSATFSSLFVVIPEPATLSLLLVGAAFGFRRR